MGISVLYVRISSLDGKTDRQRVNEEEFDRVILMLKLNKPKYILLGRLLFL